MNPCVKDITKRLIAKDATLSPESQRTLEDLLSDGAMAVGAVIQSNIPLSPDNNREFFAAIYLATLIYAVANLTPDTVQRMADATKEHYAAMHGETLSVDALRRMFGEG